MRKLILQIGAGIGIAVVILFFVLGTVWIWLTKITNDPSSDVAGKEWFISSPTSLSEEFVSNDRWGWYDCDGIEPQGITRVEWTRKRFIGQDEWGKFVYFKGLVVDQDLIARLRANIRNFSGYPGLPYFASRPPDWWRPKSKIPESLDLGRLRSQKDIYLEMHEDQFYLYWIGNRYSGHLAKSAQNKPEISSPITSRVD